MILNEVWSRAGGLSVTQRDGDRQCVDACCYCSVLSRLSVSLVYVFEVSVSATSNLAFLTVAALGCYKKGDIVQLPNQTFSEN